MLDVQVEVLRTVPNTIEGIINDGPHLGRWIIVVNLKSRDLRYKFGSVFRSPMNFAALCVVALTSASLPCKGSKLYTATVRRTKSLIDQRQSTNRPTTSEVFTTGRIADSHSIASRFLHDNREYQTRCLPKLDTAVSNHNSQAFWSYMEVNGE